ncbi:type VI secretion system Vgr family protein [Pantoea endophytica]
MNLSSLLNKVLPVSLNRYYLEIPDCVFQTDVEEFDAEENLSELYRYTIKFTSNESDIKPQQMLRKNVWLHMQDTPGILDKVLPGITRKTVHGIVTGFRRLQGSADQVFYEIEIKPFISLLEKQFRSHRFFVNKSVPEVVSQILTEHGLAGWQYQFTLKQDYPKREQINQYQESDLTFIQRLLAEVGIFYYFRLQEDARTEVVHFGDSQAAFEAGKTLPLSSPSGMGDGGTDSIWGLSQHHQVVQAGVTAKDYNHREAQYILRSAEADMTRGDGDETNYGKVYNYRARHPQSGDKFDPSAETANFYARLDHERFLASQTLVTGASTDPCLAAGQVITVTDSNFPPSLPELLLNPLVLVRLGFIASRKSAMRVLIGAVPYSETICWRPELLERPKVSGTMTARVTSAKDNDIYAWQDASGLYRVVFDADEESKDRGQESMPVRLAKPYGGDMYGFHFPLIQGTEVAIAFREGDPDQPYIAHALHDSRHVDHVTEKNSTRNVIRTAGLNKLRMEDKRGEEHIKLSTEYGGKTQLNLGHNVDAGRMLRGEGAELRTDEHISIRGGAGVFISADKQIQANGSMLDMEHAIHQLELALSIAKNLNRAAKVAKASPGDAESQYQLIKALEDLKEPGILLHAPEGIGVVSPKAVRISSGSHSVGLVSGRNTDIHAANSVTITAAQHISLFSQNSGIKLFSGKGDIDLQAQNNAMNIKAQEDLTISSLQGNVRVDASKELILTCGGAYIKISGGNIEIGCPGNILLKANNIQKMNANDLTVQTEKFRMGYSEGYTIKDSKSGMIKPYTKYKITTSEGDVVEGTSDKEGKTLPINTATPTSIRIEFPNEKIKGNKEVGK